MKTATYEKLSAIVREKGAGFILLLDPDRLALDQIAETVQRAEENGVDALFIGGTLLLSRSFDDFVRLTREAAGELPIILFPGSVFQVSKYADAILYLSVISGRNPAYLIDNQVLAAPIVWQYQIEAISCGYLLVESGQMTSAEFMSNSRPLPRHKPELALAHSLAAQYLGFKILYLEAGSGAQLSVPEEMIMAISKTISIPVIVGGGIRSPESAQKKVEAGASFVVVGNHFEKRDNFTKIREFARAIHYKKSD
ncbi:MAG: geranylgeranylglyceryl/heptaprenylglyceryl phosphate synthase [Calditrichaeota bacterium]|nr:geranylgeranylglyceryl/heptaprenylglyceryl phosphate synthase [Calditrichota bacterium]RQW04015.1 MAG: geranylgeranylglyceryl/heptaprenylglyceryl phosphate synthase [Calditrichota bacterium]